MIYFINILLFSNLLTPGNDRGDASDSISQSSQIASRHFRSIWNMNAYVSFIQNSSRVDKHERTAYYIAIQINVTYFKPLIDVDT